MESIAQNIKAARKKAGITQAELGKRLGVSSSMIALYETGRRNPKKETIRQIAFALSVPVGTLDPQLGKMPTLEDRSAALNMQIHQLQEAQGRLAPIMQILDYIRLLNEEGQQKALERIQELTEIPRYQVRNKEAEPDALNTQKDE